MTRNALLLVGMALGASGGLLSSLGDTTGLKIVMMAIGAMVGAAIGGALSRIGKRMALQRDSIPEIGVSPDDRMRMYWRDKGKSIRCLAISILKVLSATHTDSKRSWVPVC